MVTIERFHREHKFLSNFAGSPFLWQGREWRTVEHAFQAAKCTSDAEMEMIRNATTPKEAKQLGRSIQLRPDWEDIKEDIMLELVELKFRQNADLAKKLLQTGSATLIEGNRWHDNT